MMLLSEALVKGIIFGWEHALNLNQVFLGGKAEQALKSLQGGFSATSFELFKYGKFMTDFFWITFFFIVYGLKKHVTYAKSLFE